MYCIKLSSSFPYSLFLVYKRPNQLFQMNTIYYGILFRVHTFFLIYLDGYDKEVLLIPSRYVVRFQFHYYLKKIYDYDFNDVDEVSMNIFIEMIVNDFYEYVNSLNYEKEK